MSEDFLLKEEKFKELRDRLLKSAADFYGRLGALLCKDTDIASRRALAQSNFELGDLTGKVGRNEDALAAHRAVLAAREALAAEPGAGDLAKVDVGRSLMAVAVLLEATGKTGEALASYRRSKSLLAGPAGADPSARAALAVCRSQLGWLLFKTGKSADALAAFRLARADQQALAAAPEASNDARRDLAETINHIGAVLWGTGKPWQGEAELRNALAIRQKLADLNPAVTDFRSSLADSQNNLGWLLKATGRAAEAEAEYKKALAIRQKLADLNAADAGFPSSLAESHFNHGILLLNGGKPAEAEAEYRQAVAIYQKLIDDNPADAGFGQRLAESHFNHGILLLNGGKPAEAEAEFRKAVAIRQKLVDDNPSVIDFRGSLSYDYLRVAILQAWFGQDNDLSSTCEKLLSLAKDTEDPELADKAAKCCSLRQADPKRCEAALVLARRAVEHGKGSLWLVNFEMALGMAEFRSGHFAEADAALIAAATGGKDSPRVVGTSAFYRAMGLFRQGKIDLARQLATQAAAKMKPLPVDEQNPLAGGADHDDLIMWLAYKAANAMLKFEATHQEKMKD